MIPFTCPVGAIILLIKDNQVCLARRANTGYADGKYSLPGGHIDGQESIRTAAIRETKEELGIDITEDQLEFICVQHKIQGDDERVEFAFVAHNWTGTITNTEPDYCDDVQFYDLNNLPDNITVYAKRAIEAYLSNDKFQEILLDDEQA